MPPPARCLLALVAALAFSTAARADDPEHHWAWKRPVRPAIPSVKGSQPTNPIDSFLRAKLDAADISPAPAASREQLIRRVTFGLTGLPPTPEEVNAFLKDASPDAWAKVVDRLLASPRYGERWGRHWLDLARYADTNGYEFDEPRPDAWRYRDYVIRAFNSDKPFDRFIIEQLAGDEAFPADPDALVATGFNLLGPDMTDSSDQAQRRANTLNDMTDTAALAFLGLTVTCARCHDHKFEPISQADYFRLQAFFTPAVFRRDLSVSSAAEETARETALRAYQELTKDIRSAIAAIEEPHRKVLYEARLARLSPDAQAAHRTPPDKRTGGQLELVADTERRLVVSEAELAKAITADEKARMDELKAKLKAFDAKKPPAPSVAMGLTDKSGAPPKTFLLERGEINKPGAEVLAGYPAILLPDFKPVAAKVNAIPNSTGRRLTLAKWVASADNPLTARVIVNRLWQHHFGKGIVATPSDFGTRGADPTHPELLDWLACELVESKWSLKKMHRLILLSDNYQQSTQVSKEAAKLDPDNKLFSRMNRQRLEGEAVRDTLLVVSGRLNPKMGGPGVVPPGGAKALGGGRPVATTADASEYTRRSVYLFARRNLRDNFLEAFDLPDSNLSCPKRERSTTAPQALALLNSADVLDAAKALAARLTMEAKNDDERIALAYRLALGRAPAANELERAKAFLKDSPLSELCRALFSLNEFVYLD